MKKDMQRSSRSAHAPSLEPSQRQLRVGEEVRHILAEILLRGNIHDEIIVRNSISVTEVRMTPDLKQARAYIMTLGSKELDEVIVALNEIAPLLRHEMAKQLTLKFLPRLLFKPDLSYCKADRIYDLLRSPHVAQDLAVKKEDDDTAPE
jgi:ribosome-binding factor A